MDSRCGHVSLSFLWRSVQLGVCKKPKYVFSMVPHVLGESEF